MGRYFLLSRGRYCGVYCTHESSPCRRGDETAQSAVTRTCKSTDQVCSRTIDFNTGQGGRPFPLGIFQEVFDPIQPDLDSGCAARDNSSLSFSVSLADARRAGIVLGTATKYHKYAQR